MLANPYELPINQPTPEIAAWHARWRKNRIFIAGEDAIKACGTEFLPKMRADDGPTHYATHLQNTRVYPATSKIALGIWGLVFRKPDQLSTDSARVQLLSKSIMGKAWRGGFGHEAENFTKGLIGRARGIKVGGAGGGLDAGTDVRDPSAAGNGKGKGKKGAGGKSEAEKLADKIDDFWTKLEGDSKDAEATYKQLSAAAEAGKNLAVASADTAKQLEFQRLAGRDITTQEKERIATALQTQRTSKFLTDALMASEQRKYDLAEQTAVLEAKRKGITDEALETEKGVLKFRTDAQKAGVDLTDAAYKAAEAKLRTELASVQALAEQNKKLEEYKALAEAGKDVVARYSPRADLARQQEDLAKERKQLDAWFAESSKTATGAGKEELKRQYEEAVRGISKAATEATIHFQTRWIDAIDQIASNFSGKFGSVVQKLAESLQNLRSQGTSSDRSIFGGIAGLFGGKTKQAYDAQGAANAGELTSALSNPLKSLSSGFTDFKKMFKDPGQGGFGAILGKGLAKAGAGYEMGSMIGGIGQNIFGGKFGTGAKIGGTIGGLFGPIGGILGSLGGGLIGSLFGVKKDQATAAITGIGQGSVTGNNSDYTKAVTGASGSVQDGLSEIAKTLGGAVGAFDVMIGQYDGKWRVRDSSAGWNGKGGMNFKGNSAVGLNDFGDDQAAAIAYAIENAIKDGAITGLSPLIQKALTTLGTDAAIQFAKDWTAAMDDYKAMIDPVGAAIEAVVKPLDTLRETMTKVGASTEEMAKLEDYRSKKLDKALKEQTSSFRSILDQLNGSAGGFSDLTLLTQNMAKLDTFRADLAAGKTIDQSAYDTLASDIISNLGNVYGTQSQDYQAGIGLLRDTTTAALDNATNSFNAAAGSQADVASAVKQQTDAYIAGQSTTNDLLAKQNRLLEENNALLRQQYGGTSGNLMAENARMNAAW